MRSLVALRQALTCIDVLIVTVVVTHGYTKSGTSRVLAAILDCSSIS